MLKVSQTDARWSPHTQKVIQNVEQTYHNTK